MTWVLDTCVLLDLACNDKIFAGCASRAIHWIECDFGGSMDSVLAAHHAWYEHVLRKRKGEVAKRPIADVMIGAYALSKGGLITRNEDDFRSLYPTLKIFNPATGNGAAP